MWQLKKHRIISYLRRRYPRIYVYLYCFFFLLTHKANSHWKADLREIFENKTVVLLGSGKTYWDFKRQYSSKELEQAVIVGITRSIYDDIVPDIYITEISDTTVGRAWLRHIEPILRDKQNLYKDTLIIVKNLGSNKKLQSELINQFPIKLRKNIRFSIEFQAPYGTDLSARIFIRENWLINFIRRRGFAIQCRSTPFYAAMLANEFHCKKILLAGIDGFGGYFFENLENNKNYIDYHKKVIGTDKNPLASGNHSVSNRIYGKPTVTRLFIEMNKQYKNLFLVSEKSKLATWIKVHSKNG